MCFSPSRKWKQNLRRFEKRKGSVECKSAEVDSTLEVLKVREIELVGFVDKLKLTVTKLDDMDNKVEKSRSF